MYQNFEGATLFQTNVRFGRHVLFVAEQPSTVELVQAVIPYLLRSGRFGGCFVITYGWAVNAINERIANGAMSYLRPQHDSFMEFDAALMGVEPTTAFSEWSVSLCEEVARNRFVDLAALQAIGSGTVLDRKVPWHGLVPNDAVALLWQCRAQSPLFTTVSTGPTWRIPQLDRDAMRKELSISPDTRVLFFSGFPDIDYPQQPSLQERTLERVAAAMRSAAQARPDTPFVLVVREHPRAKDKLRYSEFAIPGLPKNMSVVFNPPVDYGACIAMADTVSCMPSASFAAQAYYYGRLALVLALDGHAHTGEVFRKLFQQHEIPLIAKVPNVRVASTDADMTNALLEGEGMQLGDIRGGANVIANMLLDC